jgi:glycosyltransferase involved in cell wall biosynthesis
LLAIEWFRGVRSVPILRDERVSVRSGHYPAVSMILAARDEEAAIEEGVGSMLAQDYPGDLEVVAVNDRSADRTAEILARLAARHTDTLRVLHVQQLPDGWLGKTNALHLGAAEASGEWLLFTDADVRFSPDCLPRAVDHAIGRRLDHLTLAPEIVSRDPLLRSFVASFTLFFEATQRPWRASDPSAKEHVGVGAFNLLKGDVYRAIGGHRAIRMRPDDDMKLARLVKKQGFRQDVAYGTGLIAVEWHRSVSGAVRGLSKSILPGVDYRAGAAVAGAVLLFLTNVLPFAGLLFPDRRVRAFCGLSVLVISSMYARRARYSGPPWWYAALHPVGSSFLVYAVLRSVYTILSGGGVEWRGTKYPLGQLKDNVV